MKKILSFLLLSAVHVCLGDTSINNQPEIRFIGGNDRVLPSKFRTSVLEAADVFLNRSDEAFLTVIEQVVTPYAMDEETADIEGESTINASTVVYDDATILDVIQINFSKQIRGTLSRGETYYMQLNGGGMLKVGDSFPAEIPQIKGQSFTVTILEITSQGYTLKLNDVIQGVLFEKTSGIIKNSDK